VIFMSLVVQDRFANLFFQYQIASDAQPMFSALGIFLADGLDVADQIGACKECLNVGTTLLATLAPTDYTLGPGHADLGVTGGDNILVDGISSTTGIDDANSLPNNCAYIVKKATATGGRHGRGRMFLPGVNSAFVNDNGVIQSEQLTSMQAAIEAFAVGLLGVDNVEGLILFHEAIPGGPDVLPSGIVGLTVEAQIGTQRRRMR
jgi:hypothetical protein